LVLSLHLMFTMHDHKNLKILLDSFRTDFAYGPEDNLVTNVATWHVNLKKLCSRSASAHVTVSPAAEPTPVLLTDAQGT